MSGFNPKEIIDTCSHFSNAMSENLTPEKEFSEDLDTRIRQLIVKDRIMLFLKGSQKEPFCKFSKMIVSILAKYNLNYSHFDVLEDKEVRESTNICNFVKL